MLRYVFIGCLGYLLACQNPSSSEHNDHSIDHSSFTKDAEKSSGTSLTASIENLKQHAFRIQRLRGEVHQLLDSLYRLKKSEDLFQKINEYEQAYFSLSEADEKFIIWQNQNLTNYDSLQSLADSSLIRQEQQKIELLTTQLRQNLEQAERIFESEPSR